MGVKRSRPAFGLGADMDLDNTESCGEWLTRFLSCFYNCTDWLPPSVDSPAERIVNIGNVVCVKTVILFPFCSGVRHFSMRRFQEHTIRWEIILEKIFSQSL